MIELKMMTGKAALRLAKEESGLTQGEIADRLGVSHAVTKRYFNINDAYMPSLEMIPRLCVALGNDILVRWLEARLQGGEKFSREEIEDEMVRAANAFEELRALVNGGRRLSFRAGHAVRRQQAGFGIGMYPRNTVRALPAQDQRGLAALSLVEVPEEIGEALSG